MNDNDHAISEKIDYYPGSPETFDTQECSKRVHEKGYEYFAVQDGNTCWSSADAGETYDLYGKANGCTNGRGGPWMNSVYIIIDNSKAFFFLKCANG